MNPDNHRKRILLVDDELDIVKLLSCRLKNWGYEVLTAANGEEGLSVAEEQQPDLILLDIVMSGMNGRDVCARLKAHPKTLNIPVVFLTALAMPQHIERGLNLGADDYIIKPFDAREMKERIEECLLQQSNEQIVPLS